MSRHILDRNTGQRGDRAAAYTEIERSGAQAGPHPNTERLQRRTPETPADGTRASEFVRIERGKTA